MIDIKETAFVDKVERVDFPVIEGYKNITVNEPYFVGHFPGNPIMPGVLQLEALVELAWFLYDAKVEMVKVVRLKFRRPVRPGDRLDFYVEETERQEGIASVSVRASVDGETSCEGVVQFKLM